MVLPEALKVEVGLLGRPKESVLLVEGAPEPGKGLGGG